MSRSWIYLVTDAVMRSDPPQAGYTASTCADRPDLWLVAVTGWYSVPEQAHWEQLDGVTCLHLEDHGQPAPPDLVAAFASLGARPGHTRRAVLTLARQRHTDLVI